MSCCPGLAMRVADQVQRRLRRRSRFIASRWRADAFVPTSPRAICFAMTRTSGSSAPFFHDFLRTGTSTSSGSAGFETLADSSLRKVRFTPAFRARIAVRELLSFSPYVFRRSRT
jgi:hypothetical protein